MISRKQKTRNDIQEEAVLSNIESGFMSTLVLCTGAGKSKCAIDIIKAILDLNREIKVLLVVPTAKLRDSNWQKEFDKWGFNDFYENNLTRSCYASLLKYQSIEWDMIILDEVHHLTERHIEFFENCNYKRVVGLTATIPDDPLKKAIIDTVAPISYEYSLEEGVYDGVVSPFEINVVYIDLDDKHKYIEAGSKARRFYQTEFEKNKYLNEKIYLLRDEVSENRKKLNNYINSYGFNENDDVIEQYKKTIERLQARQEQLIFNRLHFIKQLKSKTIAARELFDHVYNDDNRYVIFCGSIKQADELSENKFHSKVDGSDYERFVNEEINVLAVVDALNEGHNIPNLDEIIIVQLSSKELALIQRIGRVVRYKEGHVAQIYILVARGSQDENWFNKSTESFSSVPIRYYDNVEDFKNKIEIKQKSMLL